LESSVCVRSIRPVRIQSLWLTARDTVERQAGTLPIAARDVKTAWATAKDRKATDMDGTATENGSRRDFVIQSVTGSRQSPNIQHTSRPMRVRGSFGQRYSTVGDDWTIPMPATALELTGQLPSRRIIHAHHAASIVDEQKISRDDWTRPTVGVAPGLRESAGAIRPRGRAATVRGEDPRCIATAPNHRR
jgi:hypothetical protein